MKYTTDFLKKHNIDIKDLSKHSELDMLKLPMFGSKRLTQAFIILGERGEAYANDEAVIYSSTQDAVAALLYAVIKDSELGSTISKKTAYLIGAYKRIAVLESAPLECRMTGDSLKRKHFKVL